jgi:type II secretory pathway predicted ATPase ExeA
VRAPFQNPFRPGAGHRPPYLAGRKQEQAEFRWLLKQTVVTDNLVLTGRRGVGKTVLLEEFKPIALQEGWFWVGTDLSEAASISDTNLAIRLITDLSVVTSSIAVGQDTSLGAGFISKENVQNITLGFDLLMAIYGSTPGLVVDKLKAVFTAIAPHVALSGKKGIIFAYDEAQNLSDHAQKNEYPLSLLLDLFQSIQRQNIPFMLVLSGLPSLFPKLVEARTYAERMFRVMFLSQLTETESKEAITTPMAAASCPVHFSPVAVTMIYRHSGGYPYFIQFICREAYDSYIQKTIDGVQPVVPFGEIIRKLDTDFFLAGGQKSATGSKTCYL